MNIYTQTRKPAVAGMWYPRAEKELDLMLSDFFNNVKLTEEQKMIEPLGIIAPHAGFVYSGQVASYGYSLLKDKCYDTVILLGSSHRYLTNAISIYDGDLYQTPLGKVEIDKDFTQKIIAANSSFGFYEEIHAQEHSLESQMPFLQHQMSNFKVVPILTSTQDFGLLNDLAEILVKIIQDSNKKVLLVCSTDMSHYHNYKFAVKMDKQTIELIINKNVEDLKAGILSGKNELCGFYALYPFLKILKSAFNVEDGILLNYANSGDAMGDTNSSQVVGYCSIVYPKISVAETAMLTKEEQQYLLNSARQSIKYYLENKKYYKPDKPASDILNQKLAVFVTLNKNNALRGCIGQLIAREPLCEAVNNMAVSAAFEDYRFNKVTKDELDDIKIEISVLTPQERIYDYKKIRMGIDGVWIRKGMKSGVFLPQVATETGWDRDTFLENLCSHKAYLSKDAYKDPATEIYIFQVCKFKE